ncbi:MAG TPA: NAD-dependent epimerase/dehydratase family protein [Xanthobacteraceae bacterium]|nr:NAD-dependent epimerase/dehydratase family protein [Xanthobacteraceae bacterium]
MSTCAITGANGYVGRALVRRFLADGWTVVALVRQPTLAPPGCEARVFALGGVPLPALLAGVDLLVHAAYDFSARCWADNCRVNAVGSDLLFDAAARAGVRRQIFISSMAAFEGCRSLYGLGKLAAEDAALIRGGAVVRPGVIYSEDNGGLAAQVQATARKFALVPMIGNGRYPFYTCHLDDLATLIAHLARTQDWPRGVITAANSSPVTLRRLVESVKPTPRIVPVPWRLLAGGLRLAEIFGLRLAFRADSVVSLVHGNKAPDFTLLQNIAVTFRPYAPKK